MKANYAVKEDGRVYLTFANGEKFYFPKRVPKPVNHPFGPNDPAALMVSDRTLTQLDQLTLPRYGLADYVNTHSEADEASRT